MLTHSPMDPIPWNEGSSCASKRVWPRVQFNPG